ncbi:MAG TPA: ABC transporter ATP-binding protein [Chthoniobacterales bacterium]|jgi:multiple sugar transport system ATP-binding protein
MASVFVKNVSKIYPDEKGRKVAAVKDLNIEIPDREFVVLVGPAGCGKSTLLRMIAGLEKVSRGEICIAEKRANELAPKDRDIAMVFQEDALYPHLNVFDNLAFGLKLRKHAEPEIKKRVIDTAAILGIESLLERKPRTLSAEQRQRLALGRAIVRQPKALLLDEPLAMLKGETRMRLRAEITKLHQRLQTTTIYAARNPIEAMTVADRLVVMEGGTVQQDDTPLNVYNEPANLFVAGFFGRPPMNFIKGTLKADGHDLRFRESEGGTIGITLPAENLLAARGFTGKSVILGIRPEDIEASPFSREKARMSTNGFPAIVDLVEPLGGETILYVETGAHTLVCRSPLALDHQEAGHRFQLEIDLKKAHLFDPATTARIS